MIAVCQLVAAWGDTTFTFKLRNSVSKAEPSNPAEETCFIVSRRLFFNPYFTGEGWSVDGSVTKELLPPQTGATPLLLQMKLHLSNISAITCGKICRKQSYSCCQNIKQNVIVKEPYSTEAIRTLFHQNIVHRGSVCCTFNFNLIRSFNCERNNQ